MLLVNQLQKYYNEENELYISGNVFGNIWFYGYIAILVTKLVFQKIFILFH